MKDLSTGLSTTLLVLSVACAQAAPKPPNKPVITEGAQRLSVTVLVRDLSGHQLGSGVLVGSATGGYWVVTNRHVVQRQSTVCVMGADRQVTAAFVLPARTGKSSQALDLALLWLPRSSKEALMVAPLSAKLLDASQLPLVNTTGYPTPLQASPNGSGYSENEGLLLPLLKTPLEGGFDLAYTAIVQKGMSGGGIFSGGELIGINGTHANPLWPGQWKDQDGKAVNEPLNTKLELVSLGISAETIKTELKAATVPGAESLNSLGKVNCNSARPEAEEKISAPRSW